ncbi:MAG: GNAT family N-acetyltransferase [Anaerolineae bacterium]|nr:GNAT family N-acetyltransferase [Anaerolineae bacterium]
MAAEDVRIEPMSEDFILWRCLHDGPLSKTGIERVPPDGTGPGALQWGRHHEVNVPLLRKIIRTYGSCAMLARDGEEVVGFLRFYPKALFALDGAGHMCLQQAYPAGPSEVLVEQPFPTLADMGDRTLSVHCMMTGSPKQEHNPYQRKGIATRMVQSLVPWAQAQGWEAIEATAYEDLDLVYAITGQAGRRFWKRLGFRVTARDRLCIEGYDEFVRTMREQADAAGLKPDDAQNQYTLRLEL